MTREEAIRFIDEVLKGVWVNWTPTDMQCETWVYVLKTFDYENARQAIRNWSILQEKLWKEPNIAKVKGVLMAAKLKAEGKGANSPVHLYTIVKESRLGKSHLVNMPNGKQVKVSDEAGERFFVGTPAQVPDEYEIERRAECNRKSMTSITGENYVVKYSEIKGKV